jgi:DNA-binding IclR family transcriptional regulator
MKEKNKRKIIEALRGNPKGLIIRDISRITGKNRATIAKYVCDMVSEGLIEQREVGPAKLCYLKG